MKKRTDKERDAELIKRLQDKAPHVLRTKVLEAAFGAVVGNLLKESPSAERPHFYCRKCGEYHLKTHPHHAESEHRKANRHG